MKPALLIFETFLLILQLASCSVSIDDIGPEERKDTINGINVIWSRGASDEQIRVITEILEDLVWVEGGYFMMGNDIAYDKDARINESPIHPVILNDYCIMAHEISYEQVLAIMGKSDAMFDVGSGKHIYYDYQDWNYFIKCLNEKCGIELMLPTEAQWEYAARGGNLSNGYPFPGSERWEDVWSESRDCTPQSLPNELGLFNMADGYGEWCRDTYTDYINSSTPIIDPCPYEQSRYYVVRGGCYNSQGSYKYWDKNSKISSYYSYGVTDDSSDSSSDKRFCRSTARAFCGGRSRIVRCRLVLNNSNRI